MNITVIEYDVAKGIDALCELLPNLGVHAQSRPLRDSTLQIAAQLASGKATAATVDYLTATGEKFVIVIANSPDERAHLLEKWKEKNQQPLPSATLLQFPTPGAD